MRIAIVVPRYGPDVIGGAETQARGFTEEAVRRDWTVEVWTTCAHSHYTWKNVHPPGREKHGGMTVCRFPITHWNADRHIELDRRLARQGHLLTTEQYAWVESGAHSPSLYDHIARHAAEFDVLIALPCASPLAHYAAWTAPERAIVWPCLHDEPYAYIEPTRLLLESAWGVMFNSPEEGDLTVGQLGIHPRRCAVLGEGVSLALPADRTQRTKTQPRPLLYVGRLEEGKNLSMLYEYVRRYFDQDGNIRLVVLGRGPLTPPKHPSFKYRGFVSEEEKALAYASSLALCQPSLYESFSLTAMESWLAARPTLVHSDCVVTRGHVQRNKGGLWFRTYEEFTGALEWLQSNPDAAARMGENGQRYVLSNYTWEAVATRFERIVKHWREGNG